MKGAVAPILLTMCVLASVTLAQAPQQPPKPGPEQEWMGCMVGHSTGEADVKASPFGPAGKFTYTEDIEWFPGGFFLLMHWEGKGPRGAFKGLTVMGYNAEEKVYTLHAFDGSRGETYTSKGTMQGDTWTVTSEGKMGGKPVKSRYIGKGICQPSSSFTFKIENSTEGGPWLTIMEGKATKTK